MIFDVPETNQPVSERDRTLRATVNELVVHLPCRTVRGPISRTGPHCEHCPGHPGKWQSCRCEDQPVRWPGVDVSRSVELCALCCRAPAGGTSRWAWLACPNCRDVNLRAARLLGHPPLPLGRHSIMNGSAVPLSARGRELVAAQQTLLSVFYSWQFLDQWRREEVDRLADREGWRHSVHVALRTWLARFPASPEASLDAFRRCTAIDLPL